MTDGKLANWQADRQTDRQTDRQKRQGERQTDIKGMMFNQSFVQRRKIQHDQTPVKSLQFARKRISTVSFRT